MKRVLDVRDGVTETFHYHADGSFTVEATADIEPLLNENRALGESYLGDDMHHVARVDMTTIWRWMIEDGIDFKTLMNDKDAWRRTVMRRVQDPDFRKFKIAPGRY